ncbi:MAG TPA: glycosyltransferase 87 family protein, partial [Candidatus Limnocylindria bacterium]
VRTAGPAYLLPVVVLGGAWGQVLLNGNVQPALMLLLALVPVSRRGGAVALAVATMIKLHPVLGALWYLARRDWTALRWYVGAAAVLLLVQAPWLGSFARFYLSDELASPFGQLGFGLRAIHPVLWVAGTLLVAIAAIRWADTRAGWLLNIGLQLVALPRVLLVNLALVLAAPLAHPTPRTRT